VFCKPDGSQLMQRDILKYRLAPHPEKIEAGTGWAQHLSALPHHHARDGGSSGGLAAHLVGTRQNSRVRGFQKTSEGARMEIRVGRESRHGIFASRTQKSETRNVQLAQLIEFPKVE